MKFMERTPSPRLTLLVATFLVLVWGTTWAAIRISLEGYPPFLSMALRFGLASVVLGALAKRLGIPWLASGRRGWGLLASQTFGAFGLAYGLVYWAEQWVPSGLAAVLFATLPFFVAALSWLFLSREGLGAGVLVGLAVGFAGVLLIFSEDLAALGGAQVRFASVVLLIAPIAAAGSQVAVKKWGNDVHSLTLSALPMGCSSLAMFLLSLGIEREQYAPPTWIPTLAIVYLSLVGSAVTFTLYFWLLTRGNVLRVSLIAYATPVVAVAVGSFFLDEALTLRLILGSLLVLAGVFSVAGPRWRKSVG